MNRICRLIGFGVLLVAPVLAQTAQTTGAGNGPKQVSGTVSSVEAGASKIVLKADSGDAVTVTLNERSLILRIPPGETDPKKGTKIGLAEVGAGDRVVAVSRQPIAGANVEAYAVMVMSKSDVAQVRQKDQDDWRKRGTAGLVTAIDPATKAITLKSGSSQVTVQTSDKTMYHRYSPDSAKFSDAKVSNFGEIKTGDQLRVLGNRAAEGGTVTAEKIVSGSFRQIAATIVSIDAATGELKVTDLATKKPLVIRVSPDSAMKKLPPQMAAALARRFAPGANANAAASGGDIGHMLESLPAMPLAELKPGDAVMVSTTSGSDPTRVSVITLLAGVEPLLTAAPNATRDIMSGWNLGGGGGEGQ